MQGWMPRAGLLLAVTCVTQVTHPVAFAASYRGIGPYYTLNDVKAVFPYANYKFEQLGWLKKHRKFLIISGPGIDGQIGVFFKDIYYTRHENPLDKAVFDAMLFPNGYSDNYTLVVESVRWMPFSPVPLARVTGVYGNKFKRATNESNFSKYVSWKDNEIYAQLADNGEHVIFVHFGYSTDEKINRLSQLWSKNGTVPQPPQSTPAAPEPSVVPEQHPPEEQQQAAASPIDHRSVIEAIDGWNKLIADQRYLELSEEGKAQIAGAYIEKRIQDDPGFRSLTYVQQNHILARIRAGKNIDMEL